MPLICVSDGFFGGGCGAVLTAEEAHWYGASCERCATVGHERLQRWRDGEPDAEIEAALAPAFAQPEPVKH